MDTTCFDYCLTEDEHREFEKNGFFIVENVLPQGMVKDLTTVVDRLDAQYRSTEDSTDQRVPGTIDPNRPPAELVGPYDRLNLMDFVGKDEIFLELLDWYKTFPKVWGILGWNIQLYHSHMTVTPPGPPDAGEAKKRLGWHQDSARLNHELETIPQPRISLKVAFFLTDTTEEGRGNFYVLPGSQLRKTPEFPSDGVSDPEEALAVKAPSGSAVFFDRRLWHSASPNYSNIPRKVLFYGYSYRWLRPRDDMTVDHFMDRCDPIRQQLLGASTGGHGYTSPTDEDVPLKLWLAEHLGEEAVAA